MTGLWASFAVLAAIIFALVLVPEFWFRWRNRRPGPVTEEDIAGMRQLRENMAETSLILTATATLGFTKLGGLPELPPDQPWPAGPEGPLDFLLQIDLAACHDTGGPQWLPREGSLYVFCDDRWGLVDQARIVFAPPGPRTPRPPPEGAALYPERRVSLTARVSRPGMDWLNVGPGWFPQDVWDDDETEDGPLHKIGGYPDQIQNEDMSWNADWAARTFETQGHPDPRPAGLAWRLLVQIDSDESVGMSWGDSGMIYILIREADARAGDFSRTVTTSQWY